ncbi:MAG: hypothetical protein R2697_12370 [Ilumatobacteraceae bacterium]
MTRTAISILIGSALVLAACGGMTSRPTRPCPSRPPHRPRQYRRPRRRPPPHRRRLRPPAAPTTAAPTTAAPETTVPENTVPEGETISDLATANGATFIPTYTRIRAELRLRSKAPAPSRR